MSGKSIQALIQGKIKYGYFISIKVKQKESKSCIYILK